MKILNLNQIIKRIDLKLSKTEEIIYNVTHHNEDNSCSIYHYSNLCNERDALMYKLFLLYHQKNGKRINNRYQTIKWKGFNYYHLLVFLDKFGYYARKTYDPDVLQIVKDFYNIVDVKKEQYISYDKLTHRIVI